MDKWFTKYTQKLWAPDGVDGGGTVAPVTTTETPAATTTITETPAVATTEAAATVTTTTTETPAVEPATPVVEPNSVSKRIDQLTAEKYAAIRKEQQTADNLRLAQETIDQLRQATVTATTNADGTTTTAAPAQPQITTAQLREMARVEAENMSFNEKCNNTVISGKAKFQDFDAAITNLRNLSPIAAPNGSPIIPKTLLDAVFEASTAEGAPKADDIVYALGRDTAEADRIMQLSPIQQAVAIARFAAKVPVKQVPGTVRSSAPPPIKPTVGNGITVTDVRADDEKSIQMPIGDWMRQRQKDLEKKAAAR